MIPNFLYMLLIPVLFQIFNFLLFLYITFLKILYEYGIHITMKGLHTYVHMYTYTHIIEMVYLADIKFGELTTSTNI